MAATPEDTTVDMDAIDNLVDTDKANRRKDPLDGVAEPEPEVVVEEAAPAKKPEKQELTPDAGLEKLKKQLEDEKKRADEAVSARADAERRALEAAESERQARTEKQSTEIDFLTNAIATVTQANDTLEERYAAAMAAQDFAAAAKAQREMSMNSAKLLQLENGKKALESAPKPVLRQQPDVVESFAQRLTPRSAEWVRKHPEFVRDASKNRKMLAAHELAMADGHAPDSDGYFQSVEETLRIARPAADDLAGADDPMAGTAQEIVVTPAKKQPAAAPVSRSGNGTGGGRPNIVRLTAEQVEMAQMMNMTPAEYARELQALKKEGLLN